MSEASVLTWLAGALSLLGVCAEALRGDPRRSVFVRSDLALPFYAAGIAQWLCYGVKTADPALLTTCSLQFIPLTTLLRRYWRARVPA
jgi:hypothetical protein